MPCSIHRGRPNPFEGTSCHLGLIFLCKTMASSAKSRTLDLTTFGMSLIYNKNNRGPMTVPCGTPSGGFRGGAQPARAPPPPFETFFYKCPPPPFCTCAPPFETLKKKKRYSRPAIPRLLLTPPPPDVDGAPDKKVSESYQLFWDLREFLGWRRSEKKQYVVPPPLSQIPGSAPGYTWYHRYFSRHLSFQEDSLVSSCQEGFDPF